jgi:predicted DCC family thiol-disulfide oxidoreductase YuxK
VPPRTPETEILFYDGHCALCHATVKFVLRHDSTGAAFRVAPLQGETFATLISPAERAALPDSIVLRTAAGALLSRSEAMNHIFRRLGGGWKFLASILALFPRSIRDAGYDFIARIRYRVFGTRQDLCPVVPAEWRERFDP